ncbi:hypothetical protein LUX57_47105 [Actinomadura madurae]|nr:hypothetical protein [Actinomadura madurae]MCP9971735.1 hypothetical protein [Actinomadura madurae]
MTEEHALRQVTLRLWSWRDEYGNEAAWADELGAAITAAPDPWAFITGA